MRTNPAATPLGSADTLKTTGAHPSTSGVAVVGQDFGGVGSLTRLVGGENHVMIDRLRIQTRVLKRKRGQTLSNDDVGTAGSGTRHLLTDGRQ